MDVFSVLNYQGSKKNILEFLHSNITAMLDETSTILDIFSGTCSVGYSFKSKYRVYANDCELYAYSIAKALLSSGYKDFNTLKKKILTNYIKNINLQNSAYLTLAIEERNSLLKKSINDIINIYLTTPTIWNTPNLFISHHNCFDLFTTYYSNSYFGIQQAMDIDSLRFAIEEFKGQDIYYVLLTSLYFSMKECVFSKDGHMAQPLDLDKNSSRLIKQRSKSIIDIFFSKLEEFFSDNFVTSNFNNKVYNLDFSNLLKDKSIQEDVSLIYADPPYTDMQYSRYYHLLNTVTEYNYPKPTISNNGYTKGLYTENRFQSKLSTKSKSLNTFLELIDFSKKYRKDLAISFAYPIDTTNQKTDRYVMDINDLIHSCKMVFGLTSVETATIDHTHSNNRNSSPKKVKEYLIICKGR